MSQQRNGHTKVPPRDMFEGEAPPPLQRIDMLWKRVGDAEREYDLPPPSSPAHSSSYSSSSSPIQGSPPPSLGSQRDRSNPPGPSAGQPRSPPTPFWGLQAWGIPAPLYAPTTGPQIARLRGGSPGRSPDELTRGALEAEDGPRKPPERVQDGPRPPAWPKTAQDGLKAVQGGPRWPHHGSRWPQDGPRSPRKGPRGPHEAPEKSFKPLVGTMNYALSSLFVSDGPLRPQDGSMKT